MHEMGERKEAGTDQYEEGTRRKEETESGRKNTPERRQEANFPLRLATFHELSENKMPLSCAQK